MKAVVWHDVADVRLDNVREPKIEQPTDAIVRVTASAISAVDLHFVRGTMTGMEPGTVLGREGVGIVEEVGEDVRNLNVGDRVIIPATIACGACVYCRAGLYAQCDEANPNGPDAGPACFGGPKTSGPFDGLQTEFARIPHAHVGLVRIPEEVRDDQAIFLSDVFPSAYYGAELAEIAPGDTVAVFGCGPVGLLAIASAQTFEAGRVLAIDSDADRLELARAQGAEVIHSEEEDPVAALKRLTHGLGVDRAIDAGGWEAQPSQISAPHVPTKAGASIWAMTTAKKGPRGVLSNADNDSRRGGETSSSSLRWAVESLAKAGTLSVIGAYPPAASAFPIGLVMRKGLIVRAGICNHRKYIPRLLAMVRGGAVDPEQILARQEVYDSVIDAYKAFEVGRPGWVPIRLAGLNLDDDEDDRQSALQ